MMTISNLTKHQVALTQKISELRANNTDGSNNTMIAWLSASREHFGNIIKASTKSVSRQVAKGLCYRAEFRNQWFDYEEEYMCNFEAE